jgi:GNAT superfamily N-acetyltransferase
MQRSESPLPERPNPLRGYVAGADLCYAAGMTLLHTDARLVSQVHAAQFEYLRERMNVMRDVRGDAGAARYFEAEHVRACLAPGVPNPFFNQVFVSGPAHHEDIDSVFTLFDQCSMMPRFEMGPGAISRTLAEQLTERGFMHTQSDPILIQRGRAGDEHLSPDIQIHRVESVEALESFKTTYIRAWQVEAWLAPTLELYVERWLQVPGWTLYLAIRGQLPIGVGVLFENGDVAYLADAATIPEFRRRGVQSAMIARRIADASRASRRLVFSRAEFGSASQRNLERAGLHSNYTVAIWTKA